jgi:RNA polymerase sigma-70 factor, ECF subfamily
MIESAGIVTTQSGASLVSSDLEIIWISESQGGDARAFNQLVLKWEKTVYNVSLRMLQDREEAAEATQEVFLRAFKSIRSFRRESKFSTWLYRIAMNHCLTRLSQRPRGIHISIDEGSDPENPAPQFRVAETQVSELIRQEQQKQVMTALQLLPPDQRAVIELKFFQDLTFEEIAEILKTPSSTIKTRLYSGLEMLKNRLGMQV